MCRCPTGYTGRLCDTDIDECASYPCQNGGACEDGVNGYTCTCVDGFGGTNCRIDEPECDSSPCQNGATCHDLINSFVCDCKPGYTGKLCDIGEIWLFGFVMYCEMHPSNTIV